MIPTPTEIADLIRRIQMGTRGTGGSAPPGLMDEIVAVLGPARRTYYQGSGELVIPDSQYDALEDGLRVLDPNHVLLKQVGTTPTSGAWVKVKHQIPMGSLNKCQTQSEMADWQKESGTGALVVMDKLDGASLSVKYLNRQFVQAITRGDGDVGEDVTRNAALLQGMVKMLPPVLNGRPTPNVTFVRGEVICLKSDFACYFGGESNPRNTASGTLKRQSGADKCKHLSFMAYELLPDSQVMDTKGTELSCLTDMGFSTPLWSRARTHIEVEAVYQGYIQSTRDSLNYDIDGLVLTIDNGAVREAMGVSGGRPKGSVAYKFPHAQKPTILRAIRWQVGKSGRITPVAEFDTVKIGGRDIAKASLAGVEQVEHLKLFAGCNILVSLRNDVIPRVEFNLDEGIENL